MRIAPQRLRTATRSSLSLEVGVENLDRHWQLYDRRHWYGPVCLFDEE